MRFFWGAATASRWSGNAALARPRPHPSLTIRRMMRGSTAMTSEPKPPPPPPPATYTVGYAKPPKASQFKPGVSGNPKGKPKGQPTFGEILLQESERLVKVKIGDEVVQV